NSRSRTRPEEIPAPSGCRKGAKGPNDGRSPSCPEPREARHPRARTFLWRSRPPARTGMCASCRRISGARRRGPKCRATTLWRCAGFRGTLRENHARTLIMLIERIWSANSYRNFHYLIACPETGEALAIDPLEWQRCLDAARAKGWEITQILNTHEHLDHTGG